MNIVNPHICLAVGIDTLNPKLIHCNCSNCKCGITVINPYPNYYTTCPKCNEPIQFLKEQLEKLNYEKTKYYKTI